MGEVGLTDEFKKFSVSRDIWFLKDQKQKARHMQKFFFSIKESVSRSTNSQKVAIEPKHKGKKPGQRKRKQAEKTTSIFKKVRPTHDFGSSDEFLDFV